METEVNYLKRVDEYFDNIPQYKILEWSKVYGLVDVMKMIPIARQWLRDNTNKRKTRIGAYVNNWLKNQQIKMEAASTPSEGNRGAAGGLMEIARGKQ